jgi:L-lysine 2,3-aminomutase
MLRTLESYGISENRPTFKQIDVYPSQLILRILYPMKTLNKQQWQIELQNTINDPRELCELLCLPSSSLDDVIPSDFPLRVPREFVSRMQKNNLQDPLLKQVLPICDELTSPLHYTKDPLQEQMSNPIPGLLHKYHGRVLLTLSGACAIHCRYCFRRHFPYQENTPGKPGLIKILDYLKVHTDIEEVILSGGDPLTSTDERLRDIIQQLGSISHIKRLRIHTRLPIVLPSRITDTLITILRNTRLKVIIVTHCNHAQEINDRVEQAIDQLKEFTLLNQSVLLQGINDSSDELITLSLRLFDVNILPYYLHLLDPVENAAHFDVPITTAKNLIKTISAILPGYLVPKLAQEEPGKANKTILI